MAKCSEYGWKVVQDYETDALASDSAGGDEKWIAKVKKAARACK